MAAALAAILQYQFCTRSVPITIQKEFPFGKRAQG